MDFKALRESAEVVLANSEDTGNRLADKFEERQRIFESEREKLKPSGTQMKQAFNL